MSTQCGNLEWPDLIPGNFYSHDGTGDWAKHTIVFYYEGGGRHTFKWGFGYTLGFIRAAYCNNEIGNNFRLATEAEKQKLIKEMIRVGAYSQVDEYSVY